MVGLPCFVLLVLLVAEAKIFTVNIFVMTQPRHERDWIFGLQQFCLLEGKEIYFFKYRYHLMSYHFVQNCTIQVQNCQGYLDGLVLNGT